MKLICCAVAIPTLMPAVLAAENKSDPQAVLSRPRHGIESAHFRATGHRTHYAEVRSWLDRSIGFPVYAEKTLKGTAKMKTFTYYGLRQNGGVWSASQVEARIRGQSGSTLLIVDRGTTKANLDLKAFSSEQLVHF